MMLKELALRRWTVEFADKEKTNPVLLIADPKGVQGSILVYSIQKISSVPEGWIEIVVVDHTREVGVLEGSVSHFTTRNVEDWPNLDVEVFKHFEVDPTLYPEDIEYKSWLDKEYMCETPFDREARFGQSCDVLVPQPHAKSITSWSSKPDEEQLFFKDFGHRDVFPQDITKWVQDHDLAQKVVSITSPTSYNGWIVWYRAVEPF